jgi:Neuraminidase (sialidase)
VFPANATAIALVPNGASAHALQLATGTVFYTRSTDGGLTWLTNPVVLGNGNGSLQLAMVGNTIHSAWAGAAGIQYSRSIDAGVTWQSAAVLAPVVDQSAQVALVATGTNVIMAFLPNQDATVSVLRSVDAGVSWLSPTVLGAGRGIMGAADGNGVCFAWMTPGSTTAPTVSVSHSTDGGQTWQASTLQFSFSLVTNATRIGSMTYRNNTIALALQCFDWFILTILTYPGTVFVSHDQGTTWLEGQQVEQFGVRRRVAGVVEVERVDDAAAHHHPP